MPAPARSIRSVSVVIPVRDAAATLGEQLGALAAQEFGGEWEVLVVDNGCTDRTGQVVARWATKLPALRVIDGSDRPGANHARNVGARAAHGELVLFCDADDVVAPGWIEAMARAAASADVLGGALDEVTLNDPLLRAWRGPGIQPDGELPSSVNGFLPYAVSANCGLRAEVLRALGGWSEDYVGGSEDVELSWRAQLRGYRLAFVPDAVVRYRYRAGLRPLARQMYTYGVEEPHLYRDFRGAGVRRSTAEAFVRRWRWLLRHVPDLWRSAELRGRWVGAAAFHLGRLRGSVKYRTPFI